MLIFIDVSQVIVSVAVAWIDSYCFFVPLDGFGGSVGGFVNNSYIVIGAKVVRVVIDTHLIVLEGVVIVFHFVIGDSD